MEKLLILGCGDIARRALPALVQRYRVTALVRSSDVLLERAGVEVIEADLDRPETLSRLAGCAERVLHLAPPAEAGPVDARTRNALAALEPETAAGSKNSSGMLPQRMVYISTSGVYGDCQGAWVDESRTPNPQTDRARRRLDAERAIAEWARPRGVQSVILRVPGIYAADRLPLQRLRQGVPALCAEDDVYTNHIHADDLAAVVVRALESSAVSGPGASAVYNVSDDSEMKMADYFDLVADRAGLPRPPRVRRAHALSCISPAQLSFMGESRRLVNRRMKEELGIRLRYVTVADGVPLALTLPA
jgi:nucleoside-diphosphate-sugar epimerase